MKGYLSNIARQSGLRFSGGSEPVRRAGGKSKAETASEPIAPLEHEKVVMVGPGAGEQTKRPAALAAETSKSESRTKETKQTSRNKTNLEAAELPLQKPALHAESDVGEAPGHQAARSISPVETNVPLSVLAKTKQSNASEVETSIEQIEPREQTVFVEQPGTIGESKPRNAKTQTAKLRTKNAARVIPEPQTPARESDRRYFARTAQLIDGQEAAPEEARTILLHEIQEWVAAGALPDAEIVSTVGEVKPAAKAIQEIVKALEPEPGVVRIREKHVDETATTQETVTTLEPHPGVVRIREKHVEETATAEAHRQSADVEEQNFNLSIGTISVVIEGDDRPAQPPAESGRAQPTTQSSRNNAGDRFSRLSRSYL
ncbi:MAG: hypothetical protein ACKVQW_09575 [Pyrinomonadaceae bacterium]